MDISQIVEKKLRSNMDIQHFEAKDFTGRHLNHEHHNGGFHLEAIIVSNDFFNKSLIERHKFVYSIIGELLKHEIHAFSMKTLTTDEWKKLNGDI